MGLYEVHVNLLGRDKVRLLDEHDVLLVSELLEQPEERLLVLVVGLGRHVVVLEVSSSVEDDLGGLELPLLYIGLVTHKNNGDVVADPSEVLVPGLDVLVGDSRSEIEHNDRAVGVDAKVRGGLTSRPL